MAESGATIHRCHGVGTIGGSDLVVGSVASNPSHMQAAPEIPIPAPQPALSVCSADHFNVSKSFDVRLSILLVVEPLIHLFVQTPMRHRECRLQTRIYKRIIAV